MVAPKFLKFDTLALHAGQVPDPKTGSRAVPIYQTTSYAFDDASHAASLYNLERGGHIYSRLSNPTVSVLEERIAALEGGVAAVATATGHAALHLGIVTLLSAGDHIVSSKALYGGSTQLMRLTLPRFGIETTFVDPRKPEEFRDAIRPNTKLLFGEVVGNPGLEVMNVPLVAEIGHEHGIPLMIDSTFMTPYLFKPIEHGVSLIMHSVTKWLGGHGVALGGAMVDSGRFDWDSSGRFPTLTEPYAGYNDIVFTDSFGPAAFSMRMRSEGLRDFGPSMAATVAFHLLQGIETLPLRMDRHISNTEKVLEFLSANKDVSFVKHPTLEDHPDHKLAKSLLPKGAGSIISFGVKGGYEAGARFIENCQLATHLANVGDAKTLVLHPASTTHMQVPPELREAAGVRDDMIRLSVGLEDPDDIISDLKSAIRAAQKG